MPPPLLAALLPLIVSSDNVSVAIIVSLAMPPPATRAWVEKAELPLIVLLKIDKDALLPEPSL